MQFTTMSSISVHKLTILCMMIVCALSMAHVQSASINSTTTDLAEDRSFKSAPVESGRTFGVIKRLQTIALLPIMYKLGVMSAVIFLTLFLAFKSVFISTVILVLNLTFFAIKFGSFLKHDHGHYVGHSAWSAPPAPPPIQHGWPAHKDVHLHIHNAHSKPEFSIPYSTLGGHVGVSGGGGGGGHGGWDSQPYSSVVEPVWATSNYVQKGRALGGGGGGGGSGSGGDGNDNDLMPYLSAQQTTNNEKFNAIKAAIIKKRSDQREPLVIMAQNKHDDTPYSNYLNTQNRN